MLRARAMIPRALLMAGFASAVIVLLPAAQLPQKPDQPADALRSGARVPHNPAQPAGGLENPPLPDGARRKPDESEVAILKRIEEIISKRPVVTVPVDDEIRKLLIARYAIAVQRLKIYRAYYEEGQIGFTMDRLLAAMPLIRGVQLELSENPPDHVPILELCVEGAKFAKGRAEHALKLGSGTTEEVAVAGYYLCSAEIDLLRTKRKLAQPAGAVQNPPAPENGAQKPEQPADALRKAAQVPQKPDQAADGRQRLGDPAAVDDLPPDGPQKPDPIFKRLDEIIAKKPVVTGPVDQELRSLLIARRDHAVRAMNAARAYYEEGRTGIDTFYASFLRVLSAQLELSDNPAEHVPILELFVDTAKEIEKRQEAFLTVGKGAAADLHEASYFRLGLEIELLWTKRTLAQPAGAAQNPPMPKDAPQKPDESKDALSKAAQVPQPPAQPAGGLQRSGDPALVDDLRPNAAQKPDAIFKRLDEIISKKSVVTGPVDHELRSLLIPRRYLAVQAMKAARPSYEEGRITVDRFYDSADRVLYNQLELSDNPADYVPILELFVDLAQEIEKREEVLLAIGRGTVADVGEARFRHLGFEIDLLRTKNKLAKK